MSLDISNQANIWVEQNHWKFLWTPRKCILGSRWCAAQKQLRLLVNLYHHGCHYIFTARNHDSLWTIMNHSMRLCRTSLHQFDQLCFIALKMDKRNGSILTSYLYIFTTVHFAHWTDGVLQMSSRDSLASFILFNVLLKAHI